MSHLTCITTAGLLGLSEQTTPQERLMLGRASVPGSYGILTSLVCRKAGIVIGCRRWRRHMGNVGFVYFVR